MIAEVGLFRIDAEDAAEFAPVAQDIRDAFARGVEGLRFFEMRAALEDPCRWAVLAGWEALEAHERFVASAEGERQRELLGRFMISPPEVFHLPFSPSGPAPGVMPA